MTAPIPEVLVTIRELNDAWNADRAKKKKKK
jgi:hypothetical protein